MADTKTSETLSLAAFLPFRLSVLSNTLSKRIADLYREEFGLSMPQWRVMAIIGETPGLNATDIVTRTVMDKVAVSRAVAGLIEMGLVKRNAAEDDRRRALLSLTAQGQDIYARIVPMAIAEEKAATEAMSGDEIAEFNRLLGKLADVVSPGRTLW